MEWFFCPHGSRAGRLIRRFFSYLILTVTYLLLPHQLISGIITPTVFTESHRLVYLVSFIYLFLAIYPLGLISVTRFVLDLLFFNNLVKVLHVEIISYYERRIFCLLCPLVIIIAIIIIIVITVVVGSKIMKGGGFWVPLFRWVVMLVIFHFQFCWAVDHFQSVCMWFVWSYNGAKLIYSSS